MKRTSIGLFLTFMLLLIFTACQENIYMDWKLANERWYQVQKSDAKKNQFTVDSVTGICYKFISYGEKIGRQPKPTSIVIVNYKGSLIDNSVFDKSVSYQCSLQDDIIAGWKKILPKMHNGDSIVMYLPSAMAYDTISTRTKIPPHSVLIFGIKLINSYN